MRRIFNRLFTIICVSILLISGISCASDSNPPEVEKQVVTVQRSNLAVTVSVDGNLVMPQAFDLHFGAPGDVKDVLAEEGDHVKAGTILARLDDTAQRLDIMSANNNVQTVLSNLYETVPRLPQFPTNGPNSNSEVSYPFYYPNRIALTSFAWAQDEVFKARDLFQADNYTAAASELYIAVSDLEACKKIFEDAIYNPASGLGNTTWLASQGEIFWWTQQYPSSMPLILELQKVVKLIKQGQADVEKVQTLITQGNHAKSGPIFADVLSRMEDINRALTINVNKIKKKNNTTVYGRDISFYFYGAAEEKMNAALTGIEKGSLNSPDLNNNLRIAGHYMEICNAILGSNDYVLKHGLSLKNENQYNVDLENALVTLGNKQDDFLKTVILAPFDGTVVSVGVKKNDVLSAMDYSSKGTIQLVDTTTIKFQGLVDEIDVLKVETGQKATLSVDAVPAKVFTGTVSFISPYGTAETSSVVKFAVTIQLDPTDVELKGGLTTTADIAIYNAENVLVVPLSAVTTTPAGSFVTVISGDNGQTEKRQVTLGMQNFQFAEVLSGLKEGEKIIIEEKVTGAPITTTPAGPPHGGPPPGG